MVIFKMYRNDYVAITKMKKKDSKTHLIIVLLLFHLVKTLLIQNALFEFTLIGGG